MVLVLPRLVRTPFTPILCTIRWRREGGEKQLCRISSSLVLETQLVPGIVPGAPCSSGLKEITDLICQDRKRSYVIINRSSAVQDIPAAGRVLDSQSSRILSLKYIGSHTRSGFLESIWASCHSIFALRPAERLDAYNILSLSLYLSTLKYVFSGPDEPQDYDLRNSYESWDEIRRGLALYILRISLDIFPSSENDVAQQCSRRRSAALPAQDKPNTAMTKRERWAQKEARSLGIGETSQSDENCSSRKDWSKVFLLLYEMLREIRSLHMDL
uniref:Uncharacterized protein n=1 Tax=Oryza barthii TaxID=65489 RepID=A0A0D3HD90_9ORYZ